MPYLIDTDWAINAIGGDPQALGTLRRLVSLRLAVSWVTVAELYESSFRSSNPHADLAITVRFLSPYVVLRPDLTTAERFAEIRAYLRIRGQLISDFDIVIAATVLQHDLTLLTFNESDFNRIPDFRLY